MNSFETSFIPSDYSWSYIHLTKLGQRWRKFIFYFPPDKSSIRSEKAFLLDNPEAPPPPPPTPPPEIARIMKLTNIAKSGAANKWIKNGVRTCSNCSRIEQIALATSFFDFSSSAAAAFSYSDGTQSMWSEHEKTRRREEMMHWKWTQNDKQGHSVIGTWFPHSAPWRRVASIAFRTSSVSPSSFAFFVFI